MAQRSRPRSVRSDAATNTLGRRGRAEPRAPPAGRARVDRSAARWSSRRSSSAGAVRRRERARTAGSQGVARTGSPASRSATGARDRDRQRAIVDRRQVAPTAGLQRGRQVGRSGWPGAPRRSPPGGRTGSAQRRSIVSPRFDGRQLDRQATGPAAASVGRSCSVPAASGGGTATSSVRVPSLTRRAVMGE